MAKLVDAAEKVRTEWHAATDSTITPALSDALFALGKCVDETRPAINVLKNRFP